MGTHTKEFAISKILCIGGIYFTIIIRGVWGFNMSIANALRPSFRDSEDDLTAQQEEAAKRTCVKVKRLRVG